MFSAIDWPGPRVFFYDRARKMENGKMIGSEFRFTDLPERGFEVFDVSRVPRNPCWAIDMLFEAIWTLFLNFEWSNQNLEFYIKSGFSWFSNFERLNF